MAPASENSTVAIVRIGTRFCMLPDRKLQIVHLIDVVAGKNQDEFRTLGSEQFTILVNRIRSAAVSFGRSPEGEASEVTVSVPLGRSRLHSSSFECGDEARGIDIASRSTPAGVPNTNNSPE